MTYVLIERELLERANSLLCSYSSTLTDRAVTRRAISEICAILAAPRQPEGDGLEVVACMWTHENGLQLPDSIDRSPFYEGKGSFHGEPLCRLSDAQRAIAELREECKIQRNSLAGARNQLRANRLETERLAVDWLAAVAERDTLRQQLAERDATIKRLEAGIPRIQEQSHQMRQQRDKLAGLLRMVRQDGWYHPLEEHEIAQIDAALVEVGK